MSKSSQKPRKATPRKIDRRLFDEIGAEVETHKDKYKNAGKWLHQYCSEREWRKRRKEKLKKGREALEALRKELKGIETDKDWKRIAKKFADPVFARECMASELKRKITNKQEDVERLSRDIQRREVPLQIRFRDASEYLLRRYKGRKPVTVEDARRIILISWLFSKRDTDAAACFWRGSHSGRWEKLMMRALKRVRLQALKESPEDKANLASTKQPGRGGQKPKGKSKAETIQPVEYSEPLTMEKWAQALNVSPNTLRKLRREKKYHFDKVHSRGWRLPKHELPAEYLEKFRQYPSQSQPKT